MGVIRVFWEVGILEWGWDLGLREIFRGGGRVKFFLCLGDGFKGGVKVVFVIFEGLVIVGKGFI